MSKRQSTRVKIEVSMTLPVGKSAKWGLDWVKATLEQRGAAMPAAAPVALVFRLAGREITYLT